MSLCFQILLSNPHMWWLQDSDSENSSHQTSPSQESIDQVSDRHCVLPWAGLAGMSRMVAGWHVSASRLQAGPAIPVVGRMWVEGSSEAVL